MKDDVCRNTNNLLDFPHGPFRHLKVMEKLAQCKYCYSLLCCIEHRIKHEKNHSLDRLFKKSRYLEGRNRSTGEDMNREWSLLTEANLTLSVKQVTFPLVCVYCKLFIANEDHLTSVLLSGPQCFSKDCHWIVSWKKIEKLCKKENKIIRVSESCEVKICQDISTSINIKKCTPVLHQNSALQKLKNLNAFLCTPEEQAFPPLELQYNFPEKSLLKQTLFFTSTPQDFMYDCEQMAFTPKSHDMAGILKRNEDGKPAGLLNHSVTFSPDVQIIHFSSDVHQYSIGGDKHSGSSDKDSSGDEQFVSSEKKWKPREKVVQCSDTDRESSVDSTGVSKSEILIHKQSVGMQSSCSNGEGCEEDAKQEIVLKIESQVEGTVFPYEISDQISEMERGAGGDGRCYAYLEHKSDTNDDEHSIADNSPDESHSEFYSGDDESQSEFYGNQNKLNPGYDENQGELNHGNQESQKMYLYKASESVKSGMYIFSSSVAPVGEDSMRSQSLTPYKAVLPDNVECRNIFSSESENLTICEKNLLSSKKMEELKVFYFNNEKPIAVISGINLREERENSDRDVVVGENEVDLEVGSDEQECRESYCSRELSVDNGVEMRSAGANEIECSSTTGCNYYNYVSDNADVTELSFPQTYKIDHCNNSVEKIFHYQPTCSISNHVENSFVNHIMSNEILSIESSQTSKGLQLANLSDDIMCRAFNTDSVSVECSSTSGCNNNNNCLSINADTGRLPYPQTHRILHCNDSVEKLTEDHPTSSVSNYLGNSFDIPNVSNEILNIPPSNILQHLNPTEDSNSFSSIGSIGNFLGESRLKKFATSLSSSWFVAKEFLSKSLRRKRQGNYISDDEPDGKIPKKKIKLSHPVHCCCAQSEFKSLPVHWKCHLEPVSVDEYKIRGRRPLSRMTKHSD